MRRQKTEDVPNHLATGWSAETFPPEQNTIQHWAANTKLLLAIIAFHANYKSWELKCFAGWNMRNLKWQVWRFCLDRNLALLFATSVLTDGRSDVVLRFSGGFRRRLHHSEGILNLRIKLNTLFMPCSNLIKLSRSEIWTDAHTSADISRAFPLCWYQDFSYRDKHQRS